MIISRKNLSFLRNLTLILLGLTAASASAEESLFNGQNLDGWKGDPRLWRVENGVLVGETDNAERKVARNTFLVWQGGELDDFEIVFKARVTGENNSGFQYRSRLVDPENFVVRGYQMDMHPNQPYNAMLYEEGGRKILCQRGQSVVISENGEQQHSDLPGGIPETDLSQWNEYRLIARGAVVEHWLDGNLAARIEDHETEKLSRKGIIAFQLHAGPPMRAEFKDIVLTRLDSKTEEAKEAKAQWIWNHPNPGADEEIFFRRPVTIPEGVKEAFVVASADNEFRLFLDGRQIANGNNWKSAAYADVASVLATPGEHLFAARAKNHDGPGGFVFRLELTLESGEKRFLVSDSEWTSTKRPTEGWHRAGYDDSSWDPSVAIAEMGAKPWDDVFAAALVETVQNPVDVSADFQLLPGFKMERIYEVPKRQGSWVALAIDGEGRLIASDQRGKLYRLELPPLNNPDATVQAGALDIPLTGAQGLLWTQDALYVVVSAADGGVYKVTDSDGDGELDHVEELLPLSGTGEHGPHGLTLSPDGKWIYLTAGNHTNIPEKFDAYMVPPVWDEDQLLPRRPDARGHARTRMAPGGWIARFTPEGDHWELVSSGYRNSYDLAFDHHGELFTYDSDMEWDHGTPWYRPTRINHVTSGSEFGWRHGTGKWPVYYEDSLPAVLDIGPGSPTGVLSGKGLKFPARYQHAMYFLDWTFATIYAVQLTPEGASYTATAEEFVAGEGLPVTHAVAGPDGAMYFAAGGRGIDSAVFRVTYTGNESTAPAPAPAIPAEATQLAKLRHSLEALHKSPDASQLDLIWNTLAHDDRFIRFAARIALEHLPLDTWRSHLDGNNQPWQTILASMALARTGAAPEQVAALNALERTDPAKLDAPRLINLMRAYGLIFARHGKPGEALRKSLAEKFDALYPAQDNDVNRELCRILVYLESPNVVAKTLRLMAAAPATPAPSWAGLLSRNGEYGKPILDMIANMPPEQNMFYAYCLRAYEGDWTEGQYRQFLTWLSEASQKSGGRSYEGFLEDFRKETLSRATPEAQKLIESWDLKVASNPFENLPTPQGPGRAWTVDEAVAAAEEGLVGRDQMNGKKMFHATLCAACHRFDGEGGSAGPDLTAVAGRFSVRDLVEAIVNPDLEISDQYEFELITLKDGSTQTGKIIEERNNNLVVAISPFDFSQTREIPRASVENIEPSPKSPMPAGLINRLNEDELRDLLAYILKTAE